MLNVPTLWMVLVFNFSALGLLWTYVLRSYPNFGSARFWAASSLAVAGAAVVTMLNGVLNSLWPLLVGGTIMIFAACLAAMGIKRFYDRPVDWRGAALITGVSFVTMAFFVAHDNIQARILTFSIAQALPLALTLRLLLWRQADQPSSPGARLAGVAASLFVGIFVIRGIGGLLRMAEFSFGEYGVVQSLLVLALMFLGLALNFGFLLMAIDRLRSEVADLALIDDLTGVSNRRHLLQRLKEECAKSERSGEPFALLIVDLDGFKQINDTHGHAAGDACLQHFALMAHTSLRPGDMLARTGGDEFCIVLPSSTLQEGAMIADRVLEVCRQDAETCVGPDIPISLSIGVAQWSPAMVAFPDQLMAAADRALYEAKKEGKNRYAIHEPPPPLVPVLGENPQARLKRKHVKH
jgi:diguanylate cyclase (GGDEF)-like protein